MKEILILLTALVSTQVIAVETAPYAGQQIRNIKALSTSDIYGLENGKGMGLAKAAELNHYPGPRHVLDEADKLSLTKEQLNKTNDLFKTMKREAIIVGNKIISSEKALDEMFANGKLSPTSLKMKLDEIGAHRAELRYVHLKTHLEQKKILSEQQVKHYDMLRGYSGKGLNHSKHNGHH